MADISKLIAKLKRERPELEDEPLLDQIEDAGSGEVPPDEETESEVETPTEDEGESPADEWMPPSDEDAESEDEAPAKGKKKIPKFPF